ncbi:MAG TPA: hypothetical protein VN827_05480 [Chthoniobacterales bacterium]|jgi:hypothetical protein|nr:hypothetical protein [Chthoniobacterales bacterium]
MNTSRLATVLFLFVVLFVAIANAQSPPPIIVQPANSSASTSTSSKATAAVADVQSTSEAIKLLEEIKAANAEVLAKQKAALEKLDELKDAADQLRIFAKRG